MLRSLKELQQYEVRATDGAVGTVTEFLVDAASWRMRYLVVKRVGHASREFLMRQSALVDFDSSTNHFQLALPISAVDSRQTVDVAQLRSEQAADAELRSAREITSCRIEGPDGPVGDVRDLVVDDKTWVVEYMVTATGSWWPGKTVLIPTQSMRRRDWLEQKLHVAMTRDAIKASPEWTETYPVDDYAHELASHYAGIPGWRGRDRSLDLNAAHAPEDEVERANARVAIHEEEQIRAADSAVIRDAREGRMP